MSSIRRFFALEAENSVFKFKIDTRNIVSGATNGSQNPLTFKLPISSTPGNRFILRVSDGRADVAVTSGTSTANSVISFATAGIYDIEIIGRMTWLGMGNGTVGYDRLKMIEINQWSLAITWENSSFSNCSNLLIKATNTVKLPSSSNLFFQNTLGFTSGKLDNILFQDVTTAVGILSGVPTVFTDLFNPFMPKLTTAGSLFSGLVLTSLSKVEIISDSITNVGALFGSILKNFNGQLVLNTPNNTNLQAVCYYLNVSPSFAKVDVRNVTNTTNHIRNPLSTSRMDETIIAWANLPFMQSGVTWNWKDSKYSNNPAVIAALNKITNDWGVIFTNLTMA